MTGGCTALHVTAQHGSVRVDLHLKIDEFLQYK